jgi:hypothetical protein
MRSLTAILILLFVTVAPARASTIGVVVIGESGFRPTLARELEAWAAGHDHALAPDFLDPQGLGLLIDCLAIEDHACARKLVEARAKADSVLFARVDVIGTQEVTIHAYWIVKQQQVAATTRVCEGCTEASLRTTADGIMKILAMSVGRAREPAPAPSRVLPAVLVIGGVSALAAGGVELYLGTKDGADVKTIYPNATPIGAALVGVGAVMVGVGIYLWTRGPKESTPVATLTPDGGFVGWAGQF